MYVPGKIAVGIMAALLLSLASTAALAADAAPAATAASTEAAPPPPPPPPPPFMHLSGMTADSTSLYLIAHGKILKYKLADMSLVQSATLPAPPPPQPPKGMEAGKMPPPHHMHGGMHGGGHGGMPQGVLVHEGYLFIWAGPVVFQYGTKDLTLKSTTQLPAPEPPPSPPCK